MAKGFLLALEGIDGAGTTTQAPRLAAHLEARGHQVCCTAEPSRGPIGRLVRQSLRDVQSPPDEAAMGLLFAADRLQHLQSTIVPALLAGTTVICDRYLLSSFAYQASVLPLAWVRELNRFARPPDLTLLLRVELEQAAARRQARGESAEIYDAAARQRRVAAAYETALGLADMGHVCAIDGGGAPAAVTARLAAVVDEFLAKWAA